jgi:hypothetical protein
VISPEHHPSIQGKEVDWIAGDFVLRSDSLTAVIANPGPERDANMTVRGVGACVIDLTPVDSPSDQLSCFYPGAGRFQFFDPKQVESGSLDQDGVFWRCRSSRSLADGEQVSQTIEYRLYDGESFLTVICTIQGKNLSKYSAIDGVRADKTFQFATLPNSHVAYCEDEVFRQTYGFQTVDANDTPQWRADRMRELRHQFATAESDSETLTWTTRLYPASSPADLVGAIYGGAPQTFMVKGAVGDQPRIQLTFTEGKLGDLKLPSRMSVASDGRSIVRMVPGTYRVRVDAIGHQATEHEINVTNQPSSHTMTLGPASRVVGTFVDESGKEIPCKATFYRVSDDSAEAPQHPDFGVDSDDGSVRNCVYSADGKFIRSIAPGSYDVLVSYGPEYDCITQRITVNAGRATELIGVLKRVVDTTGWVSAELHSHSSPSGDNTSSQLGRVENLLCEHLEFAPCTEHQRIDSYDDQLAILGAAQRMATCTGMELTGKALPLNHQNAFPLKRNPFAQDGGGPRTDDDPVIQISRLTMWDSNAPKVVQVNHPNLRQMIHDRDLDGTDDGGFSKMLDFMDIVEVHPPEDIFLSNEEILAKKNPDEVRMKRWMDLFRDGRRIPGVVNTDAHYNWHGSGWLRNWVRCSTDNPAEIKVDEMIERLETGQIVMSTGPFLSYQLFAPGKTEPADIGDEVTLSSGTDCELAVRVQCPNWIDVNRVEVFVNGEMQPQLSRRRTTHPLSFGDGVEKFNERLKLTVPNDASFIIVATIGEGLQLGRVMGDEVGKQVPVAVSNPIFINPTSTHNP